MIVYAVTASQNAVPTQPFAVHLPLEASSLMPLRVEASAPFDSA